MALVSEPIDDAFEYEAPVPSKKRKHSGRKLMALALIAALGGGAWIIKGSGVLTRAVRVVYPDYRVAQYPPKVMTTTPTDGEMAVAVGSTISADLRIARGGF